LKLRLKAKYAGVITGLIILITGVLSGILLYQFQSSSRILSQRSAESMSQELMAQMEKRAAATVHFLSDILTNPLYQYDIETINRLLKVVIQQDDVVNGVVYDHAGRIVHDGITGSIRFGESINDKATQAAIATKGKLVSQVTKDILSVSLPVWIGKTPLGGVKVELSLKGIQEDIEAMRSDLGILGQRRLGHTTWTVVVTTLVLVIFSIYLSFVVSGRLIRPIQELTANVRRVGQGDYRLRIEPGSNDELGDLIGSFNSMTAALEESTVSKTYVENIIGSMTDMLIVLDADGSIRMVNQATQSLLGVGEDQITGKSFGELFQAEARQEAAAWLSELLEKGVLREQEFEFRRSDGELLSVSLSGSIMFDDQGTADAIVCVAQDITERKRVHEDLLETKRLAEAANRAKTEFLANMSHELRTPLNAIIGYSELLQEEAQDRDDDNLNEDLNKVRNAGRHLLGLINNVLDLSKVEAGKMEADIQETELGILLSEVADTVRPLFDDRNNVLEVANETTAAVIYTDSQKLRQSLLNLLGNAAKFTRDGVVRLEVTQEPEGWLNFIVSDTGIGMSADQLNKILQPFAQADTSTNKRYGGTGLGLAITKSFAELLGGRLEVESQLGQGSRFMISLPVRKSEDAGAIVHSA
jgi:PAS domain S-box-containing protein